MNATRIYVGAVAASAAAAVAAASWLAGAPGAGDLMPVAGFAIAMLLVQLLPVPFPRGSQLELVRVEEAVVVPLVLLLEPAPALVAVAVGVLAALLGMGRDPLKAIFNTAQLVLAVSAALLVTWAVAGETAPGFGAAPLAAAVLGLVAMFVVNQLLVAGVMRIAAGTPMRSLLFDDMALKGSMWVANAAIGMLLVLPAAQAPALLLVALVPLAMLHGAWRVHAERAGEEQRLRELGSAVGGLSGAVSIHRVATALVESAREVVDATGAEVRLFEDGRVFWARRTPAGIETGDGRVDSGERTDEGSRVAFTVALTGGEGVFGELGVWHEREPNAASRSFSRRDRTLLEMLGHQAASALDNSRLSTRTELQQQTIAQVFDHSSEGMLVLDRRGRVRGWNPAMQQISGFEHSTVDASPISLISPQLAAIVDEREAGTVDAILSTADGERRHVRASFAPIDQAADPDGADDGQSWVVVVRDVTLEQETERLKDDFVATVSHELRTPLTAIKGFLETMQREDIELGAGQVRMFLQIMGEQANRLERLIGDLLDMSAIESGRPLEVGVSPVDLSSTVRRTITVFEAARPQAQVLLSGTDIDIVVAADPQRLEQVLTNLLDNALKHGGAQTPIQVAIGRTESGQGAVCVADQGPGISAVDQRRIFERFFVAADSVTRNGGGAGLGLYICQRLVAAMHGKISVRSKVGEGSTFEVALPILAATMPGSDEDARSDEHPQVTARLESL